MRITNKQWAGYLKARREWITVNDCYNKRAYGITQAEYGIINRAVTELCGICEDKSAVTLAQVNRKLVVE